VNAKPLVKEQKRTFFELEPGQFVDLQIHFPVNFRIKARLIGYELGGYIILKHPAPLQMHKYNDVFKIGNDVVARYILEGQKGQCFAFKSSIEYVSHLPEKFIYLRYPDKIENRELRAQQRVSTHLPACIQSISDSGSLSKNKINGVVADISPKGCRFIFKADNNQIKVNKKSVFVIFQMGEGKVLNIPADVRNSRYESGKVNVGIQFDDANPQVQTLLKYLLLDNY